MSQDQIMSSEELSDFNADKLNHIESIPTSPESSNGRSSTPFSTTSTNATSITDQKVDLKKNILIDSIKTKDSTNIDGTLVNGDSSPMTALSAIPTPTQTPKPTNTTDSKDDLADKKESKAEKKEKKEKDKKEKKEKKSTRTINFASGVSTSVPLTGERPRPDSHPSMDDDVLLAIFIILFDNDAESKGMTVKQICDILVEKHPDMSKLSSKTSNLVSAKLNAYVKKVEKGDSSIHYALSRDWADSSPKRMVYVYRGILSPEYPSYVQKVIEEHRIKDAAANAANAAINTSMGDAMVIDKNDYDDLSDTNLDSSNKLKAHNLSKFDERSDSARSQSPLTQDLSSLQSISPSGLQLNKISPFGNGAIDFGIPQLSVPYSVAPVTASLNVTMPLKSNNMDNVKINSTNIASDFSIKKNNEYLTVIPDSDSDDDYNTLKATFDDEDDDEETTVYANHGYYRHGSDIVTDRIPSGIGKRSKSISFINKRTKSHSSPSKQTQEEPNIRQQNSNSESQNKLSNQPRQLVTAAALTPRVPRKSMVNTPNAAAAVAALRAVALGTFGGSVNDSVNSITNSIMSDTSIEPSISVKWLETVRSGFLNQDIESPEDVSLAELETLFT